jgi:Zn-dependent peptidase ImmA (M78 family)
MAVAATSPVTPSVLGWAVGEDGRSPADIAEALKIPVDALEAWIAGDAAPTRGQVSSLAKVLQRPRALFFMPGPPAAASLPASFRHPPGVARNVSPKVRRAGRESRRIQQAISWARREAAPVEVPLQPAPTTPPAEAAAVARGWLGITAEQQLGWKNDREALRGWRTAMEAHGLLVFMLQLGADEVRGFSTWEDRAPLIVANTSGVNPPARTYTLAHELGHLVARQDATCLEPDDEGTVGGAVIETWCEQFGAALLMQAAFVDVIATTGGVVRGAADLNAVKLLMRRARVSARAAARRLIDLGWAAPSLYASVIKTFTVSQKQTGTPMSPKRYEDRLRSYGPDVITTVFDALPIRDALSVLRIEVQDARTLAEYLPGLRVP